MSTHRRRFLRLCGVAGLGAVAGCYGGFEDGETTADDETPAESETTTGATGTMEPAAKIVPDDGHSRDLFGRSVAMSSDGTTALVGAWVDDDPNGHFAGSAYVFENSGGSWTQQAKLTADDGDKYDRFGEVVALSNDGTTALIGARFDEGPNGDDLGSAYVFENSGGSWSQQAKLAAGDADSADYFAKAVALSNDGTTALIGASIDEDPNGRKAGSAYVFENSGDSWTQRTKLAADDGDSDDLFGFSVAISNDGTTALIGARTDEDPNGEYGGSAYVFDSSGGSWSQQAKLAADDGDSGDWVGSAVELDEDGTTALITATEDEDPNGPGAGSAYVFENSGGSWSQRSKLAADDGDRDDSLGVSVALSNDGMTALIGAYGDEDPNGSGAGSAYVFENSGGFWAQRTKLAADDGEIDDQFGESVAMSSDGTTALVGASEEDTNGENSGSAYAFQL